MGLAPLDRSTLDRLQVALAGAAPAWSARARLSRLGRWPVGEAFDVSLPGSLDESIQAHRPGGMRAKPTLGLDRWTSAEMRARLTGADRGASIDIACVGSPRSGEPASISGLLVETTRREIDGDPAGVWIERLFRAMCAQLAPPWARAGSLGERMSGRRRGAGGRVEWLTYLGHEAAAGVRVGDLRGIDGVDVEDLSGGLLIRLDPSPGSRRTTAYWQRLQTVEATIGRPRPVAAEPPQSGTESMARPIRPAVGVPIPLVPRPTVTRTEGGTRHLQGARYERARFAQLQLREPGAVLEGFEAVRCEFDNVALGPRADGAQPVVVRSCTLTRRRSRAVSLGLVVVEDCLIDGHAGGFMATASVLLRHVVMRGPIDALDLRSPRQLQVASRPSLPRLHAEHYRTVDWTLDIREARFRRCDIGGVPGHLVRRDPTTQVLVTRARALAGPWREATGGHFWRVGIERLLESGDDSRVFVAGPRGDRFEQELAVIGRLREAGIAVPD